MAASDPPGYFVGRPLQLQEQEPQEAVTPPPAPAAAADEHNAANAQVPGYYAGPVQGRRDPAAEHNNNPGDTAVTQRQEPGFLAKWFGCFSGSSGN